MVLVSHRCLGQSHVMLVSGSESCGVGVWVRVTWCWCLGQSHMVLVSHSCLGQSHVVLVSHSCLGQSHMVLVSHSCLGQSHVVLVSGSESHGVGVWVRVTWCWCLGQSHVVLLSGSESCGVGVPQLSGSEVQHLTAAGVELVR